MPEPINKQSYALREYLIHSFGEDHIDIADLFMENFFPPRTDLVKEMTMAEVAVRWVEGAEMIAGGILETKQRVNHGSSTTAELPGRVELTGKLPQLNGSEDQITVSIAETILLKKDRSQRLLGFNGAVSVKLRLSNLEASLQNFDVSDSLRLVPENLTSFTVDSCSVFEKDLSVGQALKRGQTVSNGASHSRKTSAKAASSSQSATEEKEEKSSTEKVIRFHLKPTSNSVKDVIGENFLYDISKDELTALFSKLKKTIIIENNPTIRVDF